jgi:hypothetical protein
MFEHRHEAIGALTPKSVHTSEAKSADPLPRDFSPWPYRFLLS